MGTGTTTEKPKTGRGTLFMVATPIGNLEDITLRALRILKAVDLIAAEGVTHSRVLCRHYEIPTRITRYNQHNHRTKGPELLGRLTSGQDIALITNAGSPGLSDPGVLLAAEALKAGIQVSPIPGPSSVAAALSASGMRGDAFVFLGFLSPRGGRRKRELEQLRFETRTMVFFEAPHRLRSLLQDMEAVFGKRPIALFREMTKVYEEVLAGDPGAVSRSLPDDRLRGEFTVVVSGGEGPGKEQELEKGMKDEVLDLLADGSLTLKDIAGIISRREGLPYRSVYRTCLALKRAEESGPGKV